MHTKRTRNKSTSLLLLALLSLALLAGTGAEAAGFRLIYANDNLGELDGCG